MNIFAFIKKEKADIEAVDVKLKKFETIFQGTVEMSQAAKKLFEIFKNKLVQLQNRLHAILEDPLVGRFIDQGKLGLEVATAY
jgi:hypothetical protein